MPGKINECTKSPKIGLPFFATGFCKPKAHRAFDPGNKPNKAVKSPISIKKLRVVLSILILHMADMMSNFMQDREYMLVSWSLGVDQNAFLTRDQLAVNIACKIMNKFDFQANVLGQRSQRVFGLVLHLPD